MEVAGRPRRRGRPATSVRPRHGRRLLREACVEEDTAAKHDIQLYIYSVDIYITLSDLMWLHGYFASRGSIGKRPPDARRVLWVPLDQTSIKKKNEFFNLCFIFWLSLLSSIMMKKSPQICFHRRSGPASYF